jgi:ubiquitin fusion degradation protein 1
LQEEERHFKDLEENRGVSLRVQLAAAPASADAASSRGIKRAADKLLLPPSVGASLMSQDAPKNGAMLFEVAASNGGRTHAGVLEFTAPEGVVLLPDKVANCLWGLPGGSSSSDGGSSRAAYQARAGSPSAAAGPASSSSRCCGQVWVRYKRLPKGTYVRFQPELRAFHEVVGSDPELLRSTLEQCLLGYCTLSQGAWQARAGLGLLGAATMQSGGVHCLEQRLETLCHVLNLCASLAAAVYQSFVALLPPARSHLLLMTILPACRRLGAGAVRW